MKCSSQFRRVFFFSLIFLLPSIDAWAVGPSFDCASASRLDERAICANDQLAALDLIADEGYKYLRVHQGKSFANKLNLPFIKQRQACGDNVACIKKIKIESIKLFKQNGALIELPDLETMDRSHKEATSDRPVESSAGAQSTREAPQEATVAQATQGARESRERVTEPVFKEETSQPPRSQEEMASTVVSNAEKVDGSALVQPAQGASAMMDAAPVAAPIDHEETQLPRAEDKFDPEILKAHQQKFNIGFIVALVALGLIALGLSYKILVDRSASDNTFDVFAQKSKKIGSRSTLSADKSPAISATAKAPPLNALSGVALGKQKSEKIPQAWVWSQYKGQV